MAAIEQKLCKCISLYLSVCLSVCITMCVCELCFQVVCVGAKEQSVTMCMCVCVCMCVRVTENRKVNDRIKYNRQKGTKSDKNKETKALRERDRKIIKLFMS